MCIAGTNPPQPRGPKREPTQQTPGGRTGAPTRRPPPEKAIAFFGLLDPRSPLHEGEINMMVDADSYQYASTSTAVHVQYSGTASASRILLLVPINK